MSYKRIINLDGTLVSDNSPTYVIAEIGNNHQGELDLAFKLIDEAKKAGANAVKFQKRDNLNLFTKKMYDSSYLNDNSYAPTYGEHRNKLELNQEEFLKIFNYCKKVKISFFATPFDFNSLDFLESIGTPFYKVSSADHRNTPFINLLAKIKKPLVISTGGGDWASIEKAANVIKNYHDEFALLQCTAAYPCKPEDMNLNVIKSLRDKYEENVIGYLIIKMEFLWHWLQ